MQWNLGLKFPFVFYLKYSVLSYQFIVFGGALFLLKSQKSTPFFSQTILLQGFVLSVLTVFIMLFLYPLGQLILIFESRFQYQLISNRAWIFSLSFELIFALQVFYLGSLMCTIRSRIS